MATLSKQVEQDIRDLEEYEKSLKAPANPGETPPTETPPVPEAPPTEAPPAAEPSPAAADPKQPDMWEQKYRTLEGKYAAEVPRLHQEIRELSGKLDALTKSAPPVQPATPAPEPAAPAPLVTAKDIEEYGELIDVQRRVAQEVLREASAPFAAELKARDEKIAKLEQALSKTGGDVAAVSFEQRLAVAVPDFPVINNDPKWIEWLDGIDPFTGSPRRAYAEFVYANGDVEKVKQVVEFFKSTTGVAPKDTTRQQRQTELERQITPTRAHQTTSTAPTAADRIYTEAEASAGFDTVRKLNSAGKYEEATKLEVELSDAYMQGRVRG